MWLRPMPKRSPAAFEVAMSVPPLSVNKTVPAGTAASFRLIDAVARKRAVCTHDDAAGARLLRHRKRAAREANGRRRC